MSLELLTAAPPPGGAVAGDRIPLARGQVLYALDGADLGGGSGSYTLPPATPTALGGVKPGAGLAVAEDGTLTPANIASNTLLANPTGLSAVPAATTLTAILDAVLGSAQGDLAFRSGSAWIALTPGSAGQFLRTGGTGADVSWASPTGSGTVVAGTTNTLAFYAGAGTTVTSLAVGFGLSANGGTALSLAAPAPVTIDGSTIVATSGSPYAMGATDVLLFLNKTTPATSFITLPTSPVIGRDYRIVDAAGNAGSFNATITAPAGGTIDGANTFVFTSNYDVFGFMCVATGVWRLV